MSFDSTQSIEIATVGWDDARHPVQVYSVVTVCQCNRHLAVLAFVDRTHYAVIAIDLECVKRCAHRLHGSLSKRNSFQLHLRRQKWKLDR